MTSPLLDFVKELSKNRASEVVRQTAGHVVSYEGLDDGLSEEGPHIRFITNDGPGLGLANETERVL